MIHWKISVLPIALGAAAAAGFVWLGRRPRKLAQVDAGPTLDTGEAGLPAAEQEFDAEETARADAFHDFELADREADRRDGREETVDLMDAIQVETLDMDPGGVDSIETEIEVSPLDEEPLSDGERYDAVDPESLGNEFLSRAIEAPVVSPPVHEPFAPPEDEEAARIERLDRAVEVPVGSIDSDGNVELHEPHATPTQSPVELPPTEEELERRRAAEAGSTEFRRTE